MRWLMLSILFCCIIQVESQAQSPDSTRASFCNPTIEGTPRTKGVVFRYTRGAGRRVEAASDFGNGVGTIRSNRRVDLKLRAPIVLKKGFKLAAGLKYVNEKYYFSSTNGPGASYLDEINDRGLKDRIFELYAIKPFRGKDFLVIRGNLGLAGEFEGQEIRKRNSLRFSIAPLMARKFNNRLAAGAGIYAGYNFANGRTSVVPLVAYNQTFNRHWGIEALVPVNIKVRYTSRDRKTLVCGIAEYASSAYRLGFNDPLLATLPGSELSLSEIHTGISLEREIHDFLWFEIRGGLRNSIGFNLRSEGLQAISGRTTREGFLTAGIFLVPPAKWMGD